MLKIYISGGITNVPNFMENFEQAEKRLTEQGYSVINPAKVNAQMPEDTTYEQYMDMSFKMEEMADCVYFLKGWEMSKGSNREFEFALDHGKMIRFEEINHVKQAFQIINKCEQSREKYTYILGK